MLNSASGCLIQTGPLPDVLTSRPGLSMMSDMRTTLTLDDDLAGLLKQRARNSASPSRKPSIARSAPAWATRRRLGAALRRRPFRIPSGSDPASTSTSSDSSRTNWRRRLSRTKRMILPDVNVLVHAHNADSAVHEHARRWWDACLSGAEGVGLAWATMLGFVRITTNRKVVARPLPVNDVMQRLQDWLALPHVHVAHPSEVPLRAASRAARASRDRRQLTTDAHLAVLAMERGYVLYSTDSDFARFPGLRWANPCQ